MYRGCVGPFTDIKGSWIRLRTSGLGMGNCVGFIAAHNFFFGFPLENNAAPGRLPAGGILTTLED